MQRSAQPVSNARARVRAARKRCPLSVWRLAAQTGAVGPPAAHLGVQELRPLRVAVRQWAVGVGEGPAKKGREGRGRACARPQNRPPGPAGPRGCFMPTRIGLGSGGSPLAALAGVGPPPVLAERQLLQDIVHKAVPRGNRGGQLRCAGRIQRAVSEGAKNVCGRAGRGSVSEHRAVARGPQPERPAPAWRPPPPPPPRAPRGSL